MYRKLSCDEQDSVRLLTVQSLIGIAKQLEPVDTKLHLQTPLRELVMDKSWRVRFMVANQFVEVYTLTRLLLFVSSFIAFKAGECCWLRSCKGRVSQRVRKAFEG